MKNICNKNYFLIGALYFVLVGFSNKVFAKDKTPTSEKIKIADALLEKKQYSNAYELYQEIYKVDKHYSNKMLLKMAMIKELEDDISLTLYYLNEYYSLTKDKETRQYMQQLGQERRLSGYKIDDQEYISYFIDIYRTELLVTACILLLLVLAYIAFQQLYNAQLGTVSIIILVLLVSILLYLNDSKTESQYLIINKNKTRLVNKPSAGGILLKNLTFGSRYRILSKEDVWWKVAYNDERIGFIREQNVLAPKYLKKD